MKWVIQKKTASILFLAILAHSREVLAEIMEKKCRINLESIHKSFRQKVNEIIPEAEKARVFLLKKCDIFFAS